MALPVPGPCRTCAPSAGPSPCPRRAGGRLRTALALARTSLALARTSLQVLTGQVAVDAVCPGHDRGEVEHGPGTTSRLVVGRRAGSTTARRTVGGTVVVAGLIGVLGLIGVHGAATPLAAGVPAPVRRAVHVLQVADRGRRGRRLGPGLLPGIRPADDSADDPLDDTADAPADDLADATSGDAAGAAPAEPAPAGGPGTAPGTAEVGQAGPATVQEAARPTPVVRGPAPSPGTSCTAPPTVRYAGARSRALGPTTALWHAVRLDRTSGAVAGACETTVCGSLVRVGTDQQWPVAARDVCPACATLAR